MVGTPICFSLMECGLITRLNFGHYPKKEIERNNRIRDK